MRRTEQNVPWRSKRHPFVAILRADGRHLGWLAGRIGYSHAHVRQVACGGWPASERFRAAVAETARELGWPDGELFDQGGTSRAAAHSEPSSREGTAGGALYATAAGLSIPEEAPHTRSA